MSPLKRPIPTGAGCVVDLSLSTVRYLNPLPGTFVSLTSFGAHDGHKLTVRGKGMLTLQFVIRGEVIYSDGEGRRWSCAANSMLVMYRPEDSRIVIENAGKREILALSLHFDKSSVSLQPFRAVLERFCGSLATQEDQLSEQLFSNVVTSQLRQHIMSLAGACSEPTASSPIRHASATLRLLEALAELQVDTAVAAEPQLLNGDIERFCRAKRIIDERFHEPISIESLAREIAVCPTKLKRGFVALLGVTPMAYLAGRRMSWAETMLRDTDVSIGQVSWSAGYSHPCNFAVAFKRSTGLSPKQYRQERGLR